MYCQKCRTPLKLDKSLEDLSPAAFDLLVGPSAKPLPENFPSPHINYPRERKELYDRVSAKSSTPIRKRSIPPLRYGSNAQASPLAKGRHGPKSNTDMSFIEITESQVVSPSIAAQSPELLTNGKPEESKETTEKEKNGEDVQDDQTSLSYELERNQRLFSILSAHSDIDHPICTECTGLLLSSLTARLASSTRERDAYVSFLRSLQSSTSKIPTAEDVAAAELEAKDMLEKEEAAFEELKQLEAEKKALEAEIAELEEQSQALELDEREFWASRNSFDETLHAISTDLASLQQKHLYDQQQLQRLQRTNVYNDTFCIGHDGYFGTINGLRLGRLPNHHVDWAEINAAWGQTLLLLSTVAEKLNYSFQGYRLRPMGSTSRIEKIEWPQQSPDTSRSGTSSPAQTRPRNQIPTTATPKITSFDLFSAGDVPIGHLLWHRRFNNGMVAFLECLSQLGQFVEGTSDAPADERATGVRTPSSRSSAPKNRVLPYPIAGEMIGDPSIGQAVSIKLGSGLKQDEKWTKACKYALTCCKFLLAHASNIANAKDARP